MDLIHGIRAWVMPVLAALTIAFGVLGARVAAGFHVGTSVFGTELDLYAGGYGYLAHSVVPRPVVEDAAKKLRVDVGGPDCTKPYSASVVNVSAMSFGSLGANAVLAINAGARMGASRTTPARAASAATTGSPAATSSGRWACRSSTS